LFAVGEFGTVTIQYNDSGKRTQNIDHSISVPEILQIEVKELVKNNFSDVAFYDITKKTMISIEMIDGLAIDKFQQKEIILNKNLQSLLEHHKLTKEYKIIPDRIATNLGHAFIGKGLGVQKALKWLAKREITPKRFITFGDNVSDLAMAEELYKRGLLVEFVFVGEKSLLAGGEMKFPVVYTQKQCELGTLEYLKKLN
jgi:hydroxymethylpyrimidine pyrophosphatase-like HAD family hydrolase